MSLSYTLKSSNVAGATRQNIVNITLDNSYVSGGYALSAQAMGLSTIQAVQPMSPNIEFVQSSNKLKVHAAADSHSHNLLTANSAAGTALTAAANALNANVAPITITGGGASGVQNNAAANFAGANTGAPEVPAATDLSGITVTVLAIGY